MIKCFTGQKAILPQKGFYCVFYVCRTVGKNHCLARLKTNTARLAQVFSVSCIQLLIWEKYIFFAVVQQTDWETSWNDTPRWAINLWDVAFLRIIWFLGTSLRHSSNYSPLGCTTIKAFCLLPWLKGSKSAGMIIVYQITERIIYCWIILQAWYTGYAYK